MAEAVAEEYKSSLNDLNFNSKPHINMLTMLAEDNIKYAPQIVQAIVNHIQSIPPEMKLPGLYLVDSIIKNVGKQYLTLFSQNLVNLFSTVFEKVEENTRSLLYKLRQTWNDILPNKILYAVDLRVKKLDPAWPITAKAPAQSIHINPKFLDANSQQNPAPQQPVTVLKKEEDRIKQQQGEVLKQLFAKQEQLRLLEQKKLDIARMQKLVKNTPSPTHQIRNSNIPPPLVKEPCRISKVNIRPPVSRRDPRLLKTNPYAAVPSSVVPPAIMPTVSNAAVIPSQTVVPQAVVYSKKPQEIVSQVSKEILDISDKTQVKLTDKMPQTDTKEESKCAQKKSPKKPRGSSSSPVKPSSERLKNTNSNKGKNETSIKEGKIETSIKEKGHTKQHNETNSSYKELDKSTKPNRTPKEKGKSFKKKLSVSPEDKRKSSPRPLRNFRKSESQSPKKSRNRSRSPIHRSEKSKINDKEQQLKAINESEQVKEKGEKSETVPANDTDLRLHGSQSNDETTRLKGSKRDSKMLKNESSKENEHQPPLKKPREDKVDEMSDKLQESHDLFGNEDQDYRQRASDQKDDHKGWAQYKAVHPDEFKSPLRTVRENFRGKLKSRQFRRSNVGEKFYPGEFDRLGRPRLFRGRYARYADRRGHFMRGSPHRYDQLHSKEFYRDDFDLSSMFHEPDIILQEAEAKYRLGRLSECDYLELRRELKKVCENKDYWQSRERAYRVELGDRFCMEDPDRFREVAMQNSPKERFFPPTKIQGPMVPPPTSRSFKLDNRMRTIHFVDEKAIVIMDNNEPRELTFKGDSRKVYIEGLLEPVTLGFDGQSVEFEVDGKRHIMRFGAPSREIYINNYPYEATFGGPPFAAMLEDGRIYRIGLGGPPPQVVVGDKPPLPDPHFDPSELWEDVDMRRFQESSEKDVDWRHMPRENGNWDGRWNSEWDTRWNDRDYSGPRNSHMEENTERRFGDPYPQYGPWVQPEEKHPEALLPPPLPPFEKPALLPPPVLPPEQPDPSPQVESKAAPEIKVDVSTLFQKLVAAGIIGPKSYQQEETPPEKPKEEVKKEEEPVPRISLSIESLRKRYTGVVPRLYKGVQCATCGMRFEELTSAVYSRHLDWHFRANRREKDGVRKAFSRRWYYEVEDWLQYEECEDFDERAPSYFELQADSGTAEPAEVPSIAAQGQETEVCVVCEEPFQLFWVEEEEEWHLRDAVRHDDQAYHPACYQDFKKAIEAPQEAPKEEKVKEEAVVEAKPEEAVLAEEEVIQETKVEEIQEAEVEAKEEAKEEEASEMVEVKEEVVEEILEGKPGEEEIIGLISESDIEAESEQPVVESKMVVLQSGGIVVKVKAESIQPASPSVPAADKEGEATDAVEEEEAIEFRPPTPDPRFEVLPPVKKGTELSGLCVIM